MECSKRWQSILLSDLFFDHFQKYSSPWFSLLQEDLMDYNNSQDENISPFTEAWPWSMSRELSFWPYFRTYLQTSMQSLF